jgi:hypothetical protein
VARAQGILSLRNRPVRSIPENLTVEGGPGGVGRPGQGVAEGDDALGVEVVAEDLVGEGAEVVQPQPRQVSTSRNRMGKLGGWSGHAPSSASGPEYPYKNEGTPRVAESRSAARSSLRWTPRCEPRQLNTMPPSMIRACPVM